MMEVAGLIMEGLDENFMLSYLEGTRLGGLSQDRPNADDTELEAQRFMASYGEELRNHDRAALAARYDTAGATVVFNGQRIERSFDEIEARYRDQWSGPTRFEWQDLSYDLLSPDSVIVTGAFDWGTPDGIERYSYSGILQRLEGKLGIRLEVESSIPVAPEGPP